jgi:hypothetical protein
MLRSQYSSRKLSANRSRIFGSSIVWGSANEHSACLLAIGWLCDRGQPEQLTDPWFACNDILFPA